MRNSNENSRNDACVIASRVRELGYRAHRWDGDPETAVLLLSRIGTLKNDVDRDSGNVIVRWLESLAKLIEKRRVEYRSKVVAASANTSRTPRKLAGIS